MAYFLGHPVDFIVSMYICVYVVVGYGKEKLRVRFRVKVLKKNIMEGSHHFNSLTFKSALKTFLFRRALNVF